MNEKYEPSEIEQKWQELWEQTGLYRVTEDLTRPKYYSLDMFPYPSGVGLHVGHPRGYVANDVFSRTKRMQGFNVLHPMGFDSFGLPSEQYAIETGNHPGPFTDEQTVRYRKQCEILGFSYDWSREISTHHPDYYRWTQWIFLRLYNHYYDLVENKALPIESLFEKFGQLGSADNSAVHTSHDPFTAEQWNSFSELETQKILMHYRLAYQGYAEVNWCPELGTVLANDEVVTDSGGRQVSERGSHPVIKKSMRQWFMRITAYADRLLSGLDGLDWSESIKTIQRNWIGRSEGSEIDFSVSLPLAGGGSVWKSGDKNITVYTTRADTLFGATYIVLAPEHALVAELQNTITNWSEVSEYINWTQARGEDDRIASREKTGIQLQGVTATNPANGELLPVWIADYVLASYGTGAVMAVPAHDERDFEFAQKYGLPIRYTVESLDINSGPGSDAYREGDSVVERSNVLCIVEDPTGTEFLCAVWKQSDWKGFVTGGIDEGQTLDEAARQEVIEETGYHNIASITVGDFSTHGLFYQVVKKHNRLAHYRIVHVKLASLQKNETTAEEKAIADFVWVKRDEVYNFLKRQDMRFAWKIFTKTQQSFIDYGILVNSGEFSGLGSLEAKRKITKFANGRIVTKYKMRDAVFARQRYWGEPIPLRHNTTGIISPLVDSELPLVLPELDQYLPTEAGDPPLARNHAWLDAGYETNTMPGWAGSSWYWLRYMDPHNDSELASRANIAYWRDVDMYVGGAEHATGHLLYSRFWNKFLHDIGVAPTEEPFRALRNQGMILAADGSKMSKRRPEGVVTPDDMVARFGADSFRLYQCFIGPFEASQPWIIDGMVGCRRFIEKVWRLSPKVTSLQTTEKAQKVLHKTIKKVTEDIADFKFNTAVSTMMECINVWENSENISQDDFISFLKLLSPFAPHVSEELYQAHGILPLGKGELGEGSLISIHTSTWPTYNPEYLIDDTVTIALSINGKPRGELEIPMNASESEVLELARANEVYQKWTEGKTITKIIFVQNKILNIIVQ